MSVISNNLCCLCLNICKDFKTLQDENGSTTEDFDITAKYFDTKFLYTQLVKVCMSCWQFIWEFYNFQKMVLKAQKEFLNHEYDKEFQRTAITEKGLQTNFKNSTVEMESETESFKCLNSKDFPNEKIIIMKAELETEFHSNEILLNSLSPSYKKENSRDNCFSDDLNDISSSDLETKFSYDEEDDENFEIENETTKIIKNKPTEEQKLKEIDKFIAKYIPNLECIKCLKTYANYSHLQQHFRLDHPLEKCHIYCCDRRLGSRFQIEEHLLLHDDPNAFQCSICHKTFNGRYKLYTHVYAQHRKNKHKIDTVLEGEKDSKENSQSRQRVSMEHDAIIAKWQPMLECIICKQSFPNFSLLRQHFRHNHPNEECCLFCCGRKFNERSRLGEHALYHFDPDAYKCELCNARHNCKRNLYFHLRTYHPQSRDGMTPVEELIKKPPRKKRCITITSREIDNSIAQYKPSLECNVCNESYSNFTLLKSHFRIEHPSVAFYIKCCERKFNSRSEFENHLRLHFNPNAFKCEICGKCLSSVKKLRAHKKRLHFQRTPKGSDSDDGSDIDVD